MGHTELGAYRVYEQLGVGGMATVHRAHHREDSSTPLALKRMWPQFSVIPELVQAFLDEARLARHLHHPNVAQTYDFGKVDDTYYIAMELCRGPTLSQIMNRCAAANQHVPLPIALSIMMQICDALEYAHELCDASGKPFNIIHRDVTPSNVIVSPTGVVKLIDFGIAKATTSSNVRTRTGFIKGKFAYVAPEYIAGQIDPRVDLFAAGVIAHELLAGRRLFQVENDMETLRRVQTLPIDPPSKWNRQVSAELDAVVMTAVNRDPEQRWQHACEMRAAFASLAHELPTAEELAAWFESAAGPPRRSEASAVTIDISLIEEPTSPARSFGDGVLAAAARSRRRSWLVLVGTLCVLAGVAGVAYFAL